MAFQYAGLELRGDREIALEAVQHYGPLLAHAAAQVQSDPEVMMVAVKQNCNALKYAWPSIPREVVLEALKKCPFSSRP